MNNSEVLYKPFDINVHADNFLNYLEVIIREDGTIEYAIPSHQQKLQNIGKKMFGVAGFNEMASKLSLADDYMEWLCQTTKCVSVWNDFCVKPKHLTAAQIDALLKLRSKKYTHGNSSLYQGGF